VRLNFVFCELNRADFPAYVQLCARRWPRAVLTVSFVAPSTDLVPRDRTLVPRYSEVKPYLGEGLRVARQLGAQVVGFESVCGLPFCQIPGDAAALFDLPEIPLDADRSEFVREQACGDCALGSRCWGLRRGYAELYGTGELVAVPPRLGRDSPER